MAGIADSENPIEAGATPAGSDATRSGVAAVPVGMVADDLAQTRRGRYGWLSLVVAAFFGLFYAYEVWAAVSNMVALPGFYEVLGLDPATVPWWLLVIGLLIPPAGFLVAFWVGRRRNVGAKALIFLLGLAVVAGLALGVIGFEVVLRPGL